MKSLLHPPKPVRKRKPVLRPAEWLDRGLQVMDILGGTRKVDIYLCRSAALKRTVVCKMLRPEHCDDKHCRDAVRLEGEIVARLRHPHVVEGYGAALEERPYVMMQHLRGQTLSSAFLAGNYDAFSVEDVVEAALQLTEALDYVHRQGFLHLDVKPSNVMYRDGNVTLFDFSVAEPFTPERPVRTDAGTLYYKSPEQAVRGRVGYATDVFGLGTVFYQLLTGGELPYPLLPATEEGGDDRMDYTAPPAPPSAFNPTVSPALDAIALRAVQRQPEARFPTPQAFGEALRAAAAVR